MGFIKNLYLKRSLVNLLFSLVQVHFFINFIMVETLQNRNSELQLDLDKHQIIKVQTFISH